MLGMEGVISLSERHSLPHEVTTRFYHINVYNLLISLIINHLDAIDRVSLSFRQFQAGFSPRHFRTRKHFSLANA